MGRTSSHDDEGLPRHFQLFTRYFSESSHGNNVCEANRNINKSREEIQEVGVVVHGNGLQLVEDFVSQSYDHHETENYSYLCLLL